MTQYPAHQPAQRVILIRPVKFGFNPETALSNTFQAADGQLVDAKVAQDKALQEFDVLAVTLSELGLDVLIFDDTPEPHTPDSIFPNNWFSTHADGTICLYPMLAENRRNERRQDIIAALSGRFDVRQTVDLTAFENEGKFLEGTGSLVLDHENRIAYACLSPRTNEELLKLWAEKMNYTVVSFSAVDDAGQAVYHTNVLMCVGDKFAVVCLESVISDAQRDELRGSLARTGKEIVEISLRQMQSFAGNMLLLRIKTGGNILVLSQQAFGSLDTAQVETLASHAQLVPVEIPTIESCGGGSVRCMIAENFLKRK